MKRVTNILKTNKYIYFIYWMTFSLLLKIIGMFIKTDKKTILFNSYGGKKFDDSPKIIYEYMIKQKQYNDYKFYWSFDTPDDIAIPKGEKLKNNSLRFFLVALKAKYWITNSGIERGLKFKKKSTIYVNTWHGSPIKHIGLDENKSKVQLKTSKPDYFFVQSQYDYNILKRVFNLSDSNMVPVGLPRNDILSTYDENDVNSIKNKLNIPLEKKVILYAPTFREYTRDSEGCFLKPPINFEKWKKELSDEYIVLFRAHYEVVKLINFEETNFVKNFSDYKNLNDLLIISDILISDYSSIIFDYSITEKPIYNYVYDFDEYYEKRGLYFNIKEKMPNNCFENEEEMIKKIKNIDFDEEREITKKFRSEFVEYYGNATKYIDRIMRGK